MKNFFLTPFLFMLFFSMNAQTSIYDININNISGQPINLSDFKGKYVLFVNVASQCGFTYQYKDLQKLQDKYNNLVVIGVPCNQFGSQEPGTNDQIQAFCSDNYNITFIMTEKINVKGNDQHMLYKWLTTKDLNGVKNSSVKWNFQKYIIDPSGAFIDYFYSTTKPFSDKIISILEQ